jgi:DinB superfamily
MTKTARWIALLILLMSCDVAFAQKQPVRQALDEWISIVEKQVVDVADAMPADKYGFAPTSGEFAGVRTFAEQLKHLAANNYGMAARIEGRKPSADESNETGPASVKTKAEIMTYLRGSFTALHKAVAALDDVQAATVATGDKHDTIYLAVDAVAHSFNHYGQLVEYLRMNGIVPPASR